MNALIQIFTYDGSSIDTELNWGMFAVSLCPVVMASFPPFTRQLMERFYWIFTTFGLFMFQITLCLLFKVVGISVVWSALEGYSLLMLLVFSPMRLSEPYIKSRYYLYFSTYMVSFIFSVALWSYYLINDDALTNIAHLCAFITGIVLGIMVYYNKLKLVIVRKSYIHDGDTMHVYENLG